MRGTILISHGMLPLTGNKNVVDLSEHLYTDTHGIQIRFGECASRQEHMVYSRDRGVGM